jgi:hypothetical protein
MHRPHGQVVSLESRAEVAENERDAALEAARASTPRPALDLPSFEALVGEQGLARLQLAVSMHRWT